MQSYAAKSFITCALGVAMMAGCAMPPAPTTAASTQPNVLNGKVSSIDTAAAASQPARFPTSGSSAGGTMASGGQAIVIVSFADGTQGRYISDFYSPPKFAVGDPIQVVTVGNQTVFVRP